MKKQNIAVLLSSLVLLATLLPTLVAAQTATQSGLLTLTGETDIFFEGYDPVAGNTSPATVTFAGLSTSSSAQETTLTIAADSWTDTQFIGVMDLDSVDTWDLKVRGPASFTGSGLNTFTPTVIEAETSVHEWAAAPSITCNLGAAECEYATTLYTAGTGVTEQNNLAYYVDVNSGYEFPLTGGHVVAALNNSDAFDWASASFNNDISADTMILDNTLTDSGELGLFGTGINFNVGVPGGTGADTYTGTITYTLTVV